MIKLVVLVISATYAVVVSAITIRHILVPYFNAGTSVGGSNAHRHTLNDSAYAELNSEGTVIEYKNFDNVFFYADWKIDGGGSYGAISKPLKNGVAINGTTGSAQHLPPYQTLYAWRRTA